MAERPVPRETNPVVLVLARIAAAVDTREREAVARRRTMAVVEGGKQRGGEAA